MSLAEILSGEPVPRSVDQGLKEYFQRIWSKFKGSEIESSMVDEIDTHGGEWSQCFLVEVDANETFVLSTKDWRGRLLNVKLAGYQGTTANSKARGIKNPLEGGTADASAGWYYFGEAYSCSGKDYSPGSDHVVYHVDIDGGARDGYSTTAWETDLAVEIKMDKDDGSLSLISTNHDGGAPPTKYQFMVLVKAGPRFENVNVT